MTEKRENKPMLFAGFALNAAAFVTALVPLLLFLIPGGVSGGSAPLIGSGIYINAVAVAASFVGVVLTAAAKPKSGALARFSLFSERRLCHRTCRIRALSALRSRDTSAKYCLTRKSLNLKTRRSPRFVFLAEFPSSALRLIPPFRCGACFTPPQSHSGVSVTIRFAPYCRCYCKLPALCRSLSRKGGQA